MTPEELFAFDQKAYPESHWSIEDFKSELENGKLFMLKNEREILGILLYRVRDELCDLMHVSVYKKGHGYGSALINKWLLWISQEYPELKKVMLEVKSDNLPAQGLYLKHGFCKISVRKAYYRDGKDAWILEKKL